jgi:hypothetical protein
LQFEFHSIAEDRLKSPERTCTERSDADADQQLPVSRKAGAAYSERMPTSTNANRARASSHIPGHDKTAAAILAALH